MPSSAHVEPVPWPPHSTPVDLTAAATAFADTRGPDLIATNGSYRRIVQQVEDEPVCVRSVPPAHPLGFIDGVQARALLGRKSHRDISLMWVGAGTVYGDVLLGHHPRLAVVCSQLDEDEVRARAPQVPVVSLPDTTPWGLALSASEWLDRARRYVETKAVASAPESSGRVLVVDGPLPRVSDRTDLVGVVKNSLDTDWVTDPEMLPAGAGWRSPGFRIPAGRVPERSILSAFVRLHDATERHSYGHALVRVEVYEDSTVGLDAAAAMVHANRGRRSSGDPRWAIQMHTMFITEQVLKTQIPHVIRTLR